MAVTVKVLSGAAVSAAENNIADNKENPFIENNEKQIPVFDSPVSVKRGRKLSFSGILFSQIIAAAILLGAAWVLLSFCGDDAKEAVLSAVRAFG